MDNVSPSPATKSQKTASNEKAAKIVTWHVIVGVLLAFLSAGALCLIWDAVQDNGQGVTKFDHSILVWMNAHHTTTLTQFARILAWMGSPPVIVGIAVVGTIIGAIWRKLRGAAWVMPLAVLMSGLLIQGIKLTVHRARPTVFKHLLDEKGYSFPSGHSLIAMVVYGLLGYFLMHLFHHRGAKFAVAVLTGILIFLIGISRVYVGVHYPTDVLAGWAAGLPWLISCLGLHEIMSRRWAAAGEPVLEKPPAWEKAVDKAVEKTTKAA